MQYRNGSAENPQISVIIPAKNEAQGIESIFGRVRKALDETGRSYEIIVVDDGSTDETAQRAHEAGATVLCHPYNIGNGAAIKSGIRYARGFCLVMLDADGQHPPEDIPALLELLDKYHMVVGARTSNSETSFHETWQTGYTTGLPRTCAAAPSTTSPPAFGPSGPEPQRSSSHCCPTPFPTRRR